MRHALIALIIINILYFIGSFFWQSGEVESMPLVEKDIAVLEVLPEMPNSHYKGSHQPEESSCFSAGPYFSEQIAQKIAKKVKDYGLHVAVRRLSGLETLNYLVYLTPLASRKEAQTVIDDLAKFDIDDYKIVESGPYKNAIAFGTFKALEKAKRHAEYIRYLGYDARFTGQKQKRVVYWLDYDEPLGMGAPIQTWSQSVNGQRDIQIIPRACARQ